MPTPSRSTGPRLTRRAALAALVAAAGGGLAACTPNRGVDRRRRETAPEPVEPEVDPDVTVAMEALDDQTAVIDLVRATQERHPRLVDLLAPVLAVHEAHAALLAEATPEEGSPSPSPSTSPEGEEVPRTAVPGNRSRAVRRLVAAEQQLTTTAKRHAFSAQSGAFARVLGSMAAAAAQNAAVLEQAARRGAES